MDETTLFWLLFASSMILLVFIVFLQVAFINKSKRKTDRNANVFWYLLLFEGFTPFIIAFLNWMGGIVTILAIIITYLVKFYTEQWYRDHMRLKGEHNIKLKFLNHEAESEIVNVFKKRDTETKTIESTLRTNIEIIEKLTKTNFYADVIDIYLDIHPELTIEELTNGNSELTEREEELLDEIKRLKDENEKLRTPKQKTRGRKTRSDPKDPSDGEDPNENLEELLRDKDIAFKIFKRIFSDTYFHRVFFYFEFLELELDEEITCDIQALVISLHEELPHDLSLTCGLLEPEIVQGRTFTTIFAIEGILDEGIAKSINAKLNDFEVFKAFPSFFKMDTLANRIEAQNIIIEEQKEEIKIIASQRLSVDAAKQRHAGRYLIPIQQTNHKKRKWLAPHTEEEND